MAQQRVSKVCRDWIGQTREQFVMFLDETGFLHPARLGQRGPELKYPEWLIMFIDIVAVKYNKKSFVGIH